MYHIIYTQWKYIKNKQGFSLGSPSKSHNTSSPKSYCLREGIVARNQTVLVTSFAIYSKRTNSNLSSRQLKPTISGAPKPNSYLTARIP